MNFPVFPEAWIALKGKKGQQYEAAIPRIATPMLIPEVS